MPDASTPETAKPTPAYQITLANAEKWKLHKITKPVLQHGTYSFYF